MTFKDHFSQQAGDYARYRPDYPEALFEFLARTARGRELVWDAGTGSGQAALGLTKYFDRILATDPSETQIQNAVRHAQIAYTVAPAEQTDIPSGSVDLITVAQALHWFNFEAFYREARRVLKPDGLLAVWCYGLNEISPAVDEVVRHLYANIVGPYWPRERKFIDEQYQTIPFPFSELPPPALHMQQMWDLSDFVGYLQTWSATQRFRQENDQDPLDIIRKALTRAWGEAYQKRRVQWPIYFRIGRMSTLSAGRS